MEKLFHKEFDRHSDFSKHSSQKNEKFWWKQLVSKIFSHFSHIPNFNDFFEELYDLFATPAVWKLFPETREVLRELKRRGFILGVVSNWDSRLYNIVEGLSLKHYFNFVIASATAGFSKPDPMIFRLALRKISAVPEETLHVGDRYDDDVLGAKAAGIYPVLLCRRRTARTDIVAIKSLKELLPMVAQTDKKMLK